MKKVVILVTLLLKVKKKNPKECAYEDSASDCSEKKIMKKPSQKYGKMAFVKLYQEPKRSFPGVTLHCSFK